MLQIAGSSQRAYARVRRKERLNARVGEDEEIRRWTHRREAGNSQGTGQVARWNWTGENRKHINILDFKLQNYNDLRFLLVHTTANLPATGFLHFTFY